MDVLSWSRLLTTVVIILASQPEGALSLKSDDGASIELNFMFITSRNSLFNSSGSRAAVDMALERINREPALISGYHLRRTEVLDSNVC